MAAAKKSPKKIVKKIAIPLYNQLLVVANSFEAMDVILEKEFKLEVDPDLNRGLAGAVWSIESEDGVVVFLMVAPDLRTLCHESVHAAWHILDHARVVVDVENHEALAYMVDWIFATAQTCLKL